MGCLHISGCAKYPMPIQVGGGGGRGRLNFSDFKAPPPFHHNVLGDWNAQMLEQGYKRFGAYTLYHTLYKNFEILWAFNCTLFNLVIYTKYHMIFWRCIFSDTVKESNKTFVHQVM